MFSTYDRNQNRHAWNLFIRPQLFFRKIVFSRCDAPSNCFKHSLTEESPLTTVASFLFVNLKRRDMFSVYISRSDLTILHVIEYLNAPVVVQVEPSEAHGVARLLGFQQSSERKTWLPCQHVTHPQWFALIGETSLSPLPLRRVQNLKPKDCYLWMSPSGHFSLSYVPEYNAHISFTQSAGNSAPFYICLHSIPFCGLWRRAFWYVCTKISENILPSFQGRVLPFWGYKQYVPPKCWWPHRNTSCHNREDNNI
jgi:hypothetical protein